LSTPPQFCRESQLDQLRERHEPWDMVVVGGGATGVGIALDAAARGYQVALFEQCDFGKGTSSRSTKLIHGGVRYLQQGNITLVRDALRERGRLRENVPHLVYPLPTVLPFYRWWESAYYGIGLKCYDLLAGHWGLGKSSHLSREQIIEQLPTIQRTNLRGGVRYYDAGFDDTRLLISLTQTAAKLGAICLNYTAVEKFIQENDKITGVVVTDHESGDSFEVSAKVVINAAGPFSDEVRRLNDPQAEPYLAASQGIHLVVDRSFLPSAAALIVPKTADGRVVFAIPWHNHTLIGTTDTPLDNVSLEPKPRQDEIDFLLETVAGYLDPAPTRADVLSVFAGIRPLVRQDGAGKTSKLGRDHSIHISPQGLVSILGGKWTTYRKMAEDCVDQAARATGLSPAACTTNEQPIIGSEGSALTGTLQVYGSLGHNVAQLIETRADYAELLDQALPYQAGQVVWAARHELARTVEDVLARRLRALFLNAQAAIRSAPRVANLLAEELGRDQLWQQQQVEDFTTLAQQYLCSDCKAT
jgi:glycerol-3-phosphate dehydrogenase